MKLKEALKRVITICPKGKDQALYRTVRFIAGSTSKVFASNGVCSILIEVDTPLPDALVSIKGLPSIVKDSGDLIAVDGIDTVQLQGNSVYRLDKTDNLEYFPSPPEIPTVFNQVLGWWLVKKILHAAATQKAAANLAVIHFTDEYVEAFDEVRLARVEMGKPWKGLVPARLFKSWPSGEVAMTFTDHHAFFKIGEEIRIGNLVIDGKYPDTDKLVTGGKESFSCLPHTEALLEVVKQATALSPINLVMLDSKEDALTVQACDANGTIQDYMGTVPILFKWGTPIKATVDGKYLQQTLKQCDTPRVKVSLGESVDPLRIESGNLIECIWQKCWG